MKNILRNNLEVNGLILVFFLEQRAAFVEGNNFIL